jgi:SAM-dependent methyltransferase
LTRACYYDDPLIEAAERFSQSDEWLATLALFPQKSGVALDLGAGRGVSSYALAKAGWRVDALEPDTSAIVGRGAIQQLTDESKLPITLLDGFAEKIPSENARYDLVYGRQVMHHAHNLQIMCNEIFRVLKPGGVFIATREHVISKQEDLPVFLASHALHHLYGGENAYLLNQYLDAMRSSGLRVQKILRQYDSVINYFPTSEEQICDIVFAPIRRILGGKLTQALMKSALAEKMKLNAAMRSRASSRDETPGRLYSFLAIKPE